MIKYDYVTKATKRSETCVVNVLATMFYKNTTINCRCQLDAAANGVPRAEV